jgi:hypothetical protein
MVSIFVLYDIFQKSYKNVCIYVNKSLWLCKNNRKCRSIEVKSGDIKRQLCHGTEKNWFVCCLKNLRDAVLIYNITSAILVMTSDSNV